MQDHATGSLLVEEAGGIITDYRGRPLDFGLGRTLGPNYGVVAARKEVHAQVIEALQAVLAEEATREEGEPVEKSSVRFFLAVWTQKIGIDFFVFSLFHSLCSREKKYIIPAVVATVLLYPRPGTSLPNSYKCRERE